jgi:hypothetical protein
MLEKDDYTLWTDCSLQQFLMQCGIINVSIMYIKGIEKNEGQF